MTKYEVQYGNEIITLPEWCKLWSDEELEEAKAHLYEEGQRKMTTDSKSVDVVPQPEPYEDEVKMLKAEGFSESEIEEIIFSVENGRTFDEAIQRLF